MGSFRTGGPVKAISSIKHSDVQERPSSAKNKKNGSKKPVITTSSKSTADARP